MVRVNPFLEVEFTTPSLKQQNRGKGVGFIVEIYNHLLTENWDSQLYEFGEEDLSAEETEEEENDQRLLIDFG